MKSIILAGYMLFALNTVGYTIVIEALIYLCYGSQPMPVQTISLCFYGRHLWGRVGVGSKEKVIIVITCVTESVSGDSGFGSRVWCL